MAAGRALPVARITFTPEAVAALMAAALSRDMLLLLSSSVPSMSKATNATRGLCRACLQGCAAQDTCVADGYRSGHMHGLDQRQCFVHKVAASVRQGLQ